MLRAAPWKPEYIPTIRQSVCRVLEWTSLSASLTVGGVGPHEQVVRHLGAQAAGHAEFGGVAFERIEHQRVEGRLALLERLQQTTGGRSIQKRQAGEGGAALSTRRQAVTPGEANTFWLVAPNTSVEPPASVEPVAPPPSTGEEGSGERRRRWAFLRVGRVCTGLDGPRVEGAALDDGFGEQPCGARTHARTRASTHD